MVAIESSIKQARVGWDFKTEVELLLYRMDIGGRLYERILDDMLKIAENPIDAGGLDFENNDFMVLHTIFGDDYSIDIHRTVINETFNIVDVGLSDKYLVVWFDLVPNETDPEHGVLNYDYEEFNYILVSKGRYAEYLLTVNDIKDLI